MWNLDNSSTAIIIEHKILMKAEHLLRLEGEGKSSFSQNDPIPFVHHILIVSDHS